MKVYIVVECSLGTDGIASANAYPFTSNQEAGEFAESLIQTMMDKMGIDDNGEWNWELEGEGWTYSVTIQEDEL